MYFEPKMSQSHINIDVLWIEQNLHHLENIELCFNICTLIIIGVIVSYML